MRILSIILVILIGSSSPAWPESVTKAHTTVDLISDAQTVSPGQSFYVGLRMKMDPHWHVYWQNPGDSGLPPKIDWHLPDGFKAGDIQWPYPVRLDYGELSGYGYENEVILLSKLTVSPAAESGIHAVTADVSWLACDEICIPGDAVLTINIAIDAIPVVNEELSERFSRIRFTWPITETNWSFRAAQNGERLFITITPSTEETYALTAIEFFPYSSELIMHDAEQKFFKTEGGEYVLELVKSNLAPDDVPEISGILVSKEGWRGLGTERAAAFNAPVSKEEAFVPELLMVDATAVRSMERDLNPIIACLFALIGGLILNLMPCVFPVLSIKVLSLIKHSEDQHHAISHALVYTFGILVSFWVLAALLIILKWSGEAIGWGFQFQSPAFVVAMTLILFLFALNLFGLFEIGTVLTRIQSARSMGYGASFTNGILAVIVATPCTAPFMGTALSFALSQSIAVAFLVFSFLGLGLALPFLILTFFPPLLRRLPKPGAWMDRFKQFLGFLTLGAVIWLAWVFGIQRGVQPMTVLLAAMLTIALGAWIYGQSEGTQNYRFRKYLGAVIILLGGSIGFYAARIPADRPAGIQSGVESLDEIKWLNYSPELIRELRAQNKTIVLDFTAAWCISCQVNERVVFHNQEVIRKFYEQGVVAVKADWTNRDATITQALADLGKSSIPVYVLYAPGRQPVLLPEIITPAIMLDALENVKK